MREFITTIDTIGELNIEGMEPLKVRCFLKNDHYANKSNEGTFEVMDYSASIMNNVKEKDFIFKDNSGRNIEGTIFGFQFKTEYNERRFILKFTANSYIQWLRWNENEIANLKVEFRMPYVKLLSRDLINSFGVYPDYIIKFVTDPLELTVDGIKIVFEERATFIKDEKIEPNAIFNLDLYPTIKIEFRESSFDKVLDDLENLFDTVLLVISFLLNHRLISFEYYAVLTDDSEKIVESFLSKNFKKGFCDDYLKKINNQNFESFFIAENINLLCDKFILKNKEKDLKRVINAFLSIDELEIFQPMFLSSYFVLEAISKLIVAPESSIGSEDLILAAMKKAEINDSDIDFISPVNSSSIKWHIYEYRNHLAHFNENEIREDLIFGEFEKIMRLTRMLILWYIEPSLKDIPFPIYYNDNK